MVVLSEKIVFMRTRLDRLKDVRHLNLWGQELTDVSILERMPSLEVMALPVNKLTSLRDLQHCTRLRELYLRKNEVTNVEEVQFLKSMKDLRVLSLEENPCTAVANYRARVLQILPQLEKLDSAAVTEKEVRNAHLLLQIAEGSCDSTPDPSYVPSPSKPAARVASALHQGAGPSLSNGYRSRSFTPRDLPSHTRPGAIDSYKDVEIKRSSSYSPDHWNTPQQSVRSTYNEVPAVASQSNGNGSMLALGDQSPYTPPHAIIKSSTPRDPAEIVAPTYHPLHHTNSLPSGSRGTRGSSPGVLYAIITLLGELDVDSLKVVKGDVEQRLAGALQ